MNEFTDTVEEIRMSPEMQAFGNWVKKGWNWLRSFIGTMGYKGWRPGYCIGLGFVALWADKIAFVSLIEQHYYIPDHIMWGLIVFNILVLTAMGIRTFEKIQLGGLAIEQTNRLLVDANNAAT